MGLAGLLCWSILIEGCLGIVFARVRNDPQCAGYWKVETHRENAYLFRAARHHQRDAEQNFLLSACPAQTASHSCYYNQPNDKVYNNTSRADLLERRVWVANGDNEGISSSCRHFHPLETILLLRNRRIIMLGDDTMGQIWQSLVCALSAKGTSSSGTASSMVPSLQIQWTKNKVFTNILSGEASFAKFNISLLYKRISNRNIRSNNVRNSTNKISSPHAQILNLLSDQATYFKKRGYNNSASAYKLLSGDILLINIGASFNNKQSYEFALETLNKSIVNYFKTRRDIRISFIETAPQHYRTYDGYFSSRNDTSLKANNSTANCFPLTKSNPTDWRNDIAYRIFGSHSIVHYIALAHGLYSEYDAHVADSHLSSYSSHSLGHSSHKAHVADCTNWCFPSGALNYMLRILYNGLYTMLNGIEHSSDASVVKKYNLLELMGFYDGLVVKGPGKALYKVESGKKRPFGSWAAFVKGGHDLSQVLTLPEEDLAELELGAPVD